MNPQVDEFLSNATQWQKEMAKLRSILLDCALNEELKWRNPCYTYKKTNLAMIANFKDYVAISFLKGVLLQDTAKLLIAPGENSQSVRFLKFTNLDEIIKHEATIKAYIFEAIEVEKAGLKVEKQKPEDLVLPEELLTKLDENETLKTAWEKLTPGRQRAYVIFINGAKQSKTRTSRVEKYRERILQGKGMNDCICGHSKRMPNCDGSHKYL